MRENNIEAFEYISARDENENINIALFTPNAMSGTEPTSTVNLNQIVYG